MHDGISLGKILPNQNKWVILGHELENENSVSPLAAPRRGLVLPVPQIRKSTVTVNIPEKLSWIFLSIVWHHMN
jgi:hypothetical protein